MNTEFKIKKLYPDVTVPKRQTEYSAGYDLHAYIKQPVCLKTGKTVCIPTGLAVAIPDGYAGFIFARSSLGVKHGITPCNCVGVIDSDYRGEIKIFLRNDSDTDYAFNPGDRIAQLVIMPVFLSPPVELSEQDDDDFYNTERSTGGFGSTGR